MASKFTKLVDAISPCKVTKICSSTKFLCLKNINICRCVYNGPSTNAHPSIQKEKETPLKYIRNIGIMAHIDAGKTTTTERMLYYSDSINTIGEVHHGDTVTDYMDQERDRGITITSASVTFNWKRHRINLIDTPGHVDFTMEVERSLRVLDGAVTVLDASAGVEAQTLTVWKQADKYKVPRLCYLNKMDKPSADVSLCLQSMKDKLHCTPIVLHWPLGSGKNFHGVVDLIKMEKFEWNPSRNEFSKSFKSSPVLDTDSTKELYKLCIDARTRLTEKLADLSNEVAEYVLEKETLEGVPPQLLMKGVREATLAQTGVPVLMGSSYKNTGVQCLMDAVLHYLPMPSERQHPTVDLYAPHLCAMAFKVIHNKQYGGVLVFIRIYSGELKKGGTVYNINKGIKEKLGRVYIAFADEYKEVESVPLGNVVIVSGLRETMTGDTIVASEKHVNAIKDKSSDDVTTNHLLMSPEVPDPVFFCSIEAPSLSQQRQLDDKLSELVREDPSLTVTSNIDTGQTVLGGMGELHLEIIRDRIRKEAKIDADIGKLEISYRESVSSSAEYTHVAERTIGTAKQYVKISLSVEPCVNYKFKTYSVNYTKDNYENISRIKLPVIKAINSGIMSGLQSGPVLCSPVIDVKVYLNWMEVGRGTSESFIIASTSQCLSLLLKNNNCHLLEPIMDIEIITPDHYSPSITQDIVCRRGQIINISNRKDMKVLNVECPLSELLGYSTALRTMTSGNASFTMELLEYRIMSAMDESKAIKNIS